MRAGPLPHRGASRIASLKEPPHEPPHVRAALRRTAGPYGTVRGRSAGDRRLRPARPARLRRHGRGLPGPYARRPPHRAQGRPQGARLRSRVPPAVRPGGGQRPPDPRAVHRPGDRFRGRGPHAVARHRVRARSLAARGRTAARAAAGAHGPAAPGGHSRGAPGHPRGGRGPPRPEAGQRAARGGRPQGDRLRDRARGRRRRAHRYGAADRHGGVHGARAGARPSGDPGDRRLRARDPGRVRRVRDRALRERAGVQRPLPGRPRASRSHPGAGRAVRPRLLVPREASRGPSAAGRADRLGAGAPPGVRAAGIHRRLAAPAGP